MLREADGGEYVGLWAANKRHGRGKQVSTDQGVISDMSSGQENYFCQVRTDLCLRSQCALQSSIEIAKKDFWMQIKKTHRTCKPWSAAIRRVGICASSLRNMAETDRCVQGDMPASLTDFGELGEVLSSICGRSWYRCW